MSEARITEARINELLVEMQRLAASAKSPSADSESTGGQQGFSTLLKASIEGVSQAQVSAVEMAAAFETGDPNVTLPEVMIALQKASLSFQAMTEVRNQLVSAYQEIMNMQI
jgi:flagellar hook-basal body complex protein FliE